MESEKAFGADNQQETMINQRREAAENTIGSMTSDMILRLQRANDLKPSTEEGIVELLRRLDATNSELKAIFDKFAKTSQKPRLERV